MERLEPWLPPPFSQLQNFLRLEKKQQALQQGENMTYTVNVGREPNTFAITIAFQCFYPNI
jgi:hypothetical protein